MPRSDERPRPERPDVLDMVYESEIGRTTPRDYFQAILKELWREGEGFNGKRPLGDSGWQFQLYKALIANGYIGGKLDEDGCVERLDDNNAADEFVQREIIDRLFCVRSPGQVETAEEFVQACGIDPACLGGIGNYAGAAMGGLINRHGAVPVGTICGRTFRIHRRLVILFGRRFRFPFSYAAFEQRWLGLQARRISDGQEASQQSQADQGQGEPSKAGQA